MQKQFLWVKTVLNGELLMAFNPVHCCMNSGCGTTHHISGAGYPLQVVVKAVCSVALQKWLLSTLCFQAMKTISWSLAMLQSEQNFKLQTKTFLQR